MLSYFEVVLSIAHFLIGEFMLLVGIAADPETQQLVTYICMSHSRYHSFVCQLTSPAMTHSPEIVQLDTVRVYHSGPV